MKQTLLKHFPSSLAFWRAPKLRATAPTPAPLRQHPGNERERCRLRTRQRRPHATRQILRQCLCRLHWAGRDITVVPTTAMSMSIPERQVYGGDAGPPMATSSPCATPTKTAKPISSNALVQTEPEKWRRAPASFVYKGALYAEEGDTILKRIVRHQPSPTAWDRHRRSPRIVNARPQNRTGPMHPFVIDASGNLFMDVGSASTQSQVKDRTSGSRLVTSPAPSCRRALIWKFDANKTNQRFSAAARYATGIATRLWHRSRSEWPALTDPARARLVAETGQSLHTPERGQNLSAGRAPENRKQGGRLFCRPYRYSTTSNKKLVQAPEYGGDGKISWAIAHLGRRRKRFSQHTGRPTDCFFTAAPSFRRGMGQSIRRVPRVVWNRAPASQQGYKVALCPARAASRLTHQRTDLRRRFRRWTSTPVSNDQG